MSIVRSACIGFNRSGNKGEVFVAVNSFINDKISEEELDIICQEVRSNNYEYQQKNNIDIPCSNDFSIGDQILDTSCLLGNIHRRFYWEGGKVPYDIYFMMINGQQKDKFDVKPLQLRYLPNSDYKYLVPELDKPADFLYSSNKPIVEFLEAKTNFKMITRPIVLDPISYLLLSRVNNIDSDVFDFLDDILAIYSSLFNNFIRIGVKRVQIDALCFNMELDHRTREIIVTTYQKMRDMLGDIKIDLVTFDSDIEDNFDTIINLPIDSLHFDTFSNEKHLDVFLSKIPSNLEISLGLVDAKNVWVNDFDRSIKIASKFISKLGMSRVIVSTNNSLIFCPLNKKFEKIPNNISDLMSFAIDKLEELDIIKNVLNKGHEKFQKKIIENREKIIKINELFNKNDIMSIENDFSEINLPKIFNYKSRKDSIKPLLKEKIFLLPNGIISRCNELLNTSVLQKQRLKEIIVLQKKCDIISIREFDNCDDNFLYLGEKSSNVIILNNNPIPHYSYNSKIPYVIIGKFDIDFKKNDLEYISFAKDLTKIPLKTTIAGPISFINGAFFPPVDKDILYKNSVLVARKRIKHLSNELNIIELDERKMILNDYDNFGKLTSFINKTFAELNNNLKTICYTGYSNFTDSIEEICKLHIDILLIESARSFHDILDLFVSLKVPMSVGVGIFDPKSSRIPTKFEILSNIKKILMPLDASQIVFCPDCELYFDKKKVTSDIINILSSYLKIDTDLVNEKLYDDE